DLTAVGLLAGADTLHGGEEVRPGRGLVVRRPLRVAREVLEPLFFQRVFPGIFALTAFLAENWIQSVENCCVVRQRVDQRARVHVQLEAALTGMVADVLADLRDVHYRERDGAHRTSQPPAARSASRPEGESWTASFLAVQKQRQCESGWRTEA